MEYKPKKVVWEITNACNAHCIHCGSKSGLKRENELTKEQALKVCDELKDLGCEFVTLIGGEFFLSPYWEDVCTRLLENGIRVGPLTNGLMLTSENISKLKKIGLKDIYISIDGVGQTHDYLRGVPGLFEKMMTNIKLAKEQGFTIGVNTAISGKNIHEIDALHSLVADIGAWVWQIQIVENVGVAENNTQLHLKVAQIYDLARKVACYRKMKKIEIFVADNIGAYCFFEPLIRDLPFKGCSGGKTSLGIQADGEVRGCLSIIGCADACEGNLHERTLTDIWNDPNCFTLYRNKTLQNLQGYCKECEYNKYCLGGCSGLVWSLTGAFNENPLCLHKYEIENNLSEPSEQDFEPIL